MQEIFLALFLHNEFHQDMVALNMHLMLKADISFGQTRYWSITFPHTHIEAIGREGIMW